MEFNVGFASRAMIRNVRTLCGVMRSETPRHMANIHRARKRRFSALIFLITLIGVAPSAYSADTTPPTTPGGFTATAVTPTRVDLSWTASTDNVGVTAYLIERCTGSGCTTFSQIASVTGTNYSNTGLSVSTSYSYRIRARDAANNRSAYTAVVTTATPADTTPPSAPTGLSITVVSDKQLNLSWTAATDDVKVTGYLVERCLGAGCTTFAQVATPTSTTYNNTGLTPSSSYSYRVRAKDAANNLSAYSSVASASTLADTTAPSAPTTVSATTVSSSKITLTWSGATDDIKVTGYRIERCQGGGCATFTQIATVTGTSYSNTGLVAATSYSYRVRANDAAGNLSNYSAVATAVTSGTDTTAPSAPTSLTATPTSDTQVALSWGASTDNIDVTGYVLERCQGASCTSFAQIATPTATTFNDTGLIGSTNYSYRVRAKDAANNLSAYSNIASATTLTPPDTQPPTAPSGLTIAVGSATQLNLSWTASTDNVGVTSYLIERCQGAGCSNFAQITTTTNASYSDAGLSDSTSYSYRVRATDAANNLSSYSNVASASTPSSDAQAPTAPSGLTATATSNVSVNLTWTASTDNVAVTGYLIERCQGSGCTDFAQIATTTNTSYSNAGLTSSTSYRYRVRATDAAGNRSDYAGIANATTPATGIDCD